MKMFNAGSPVWVRDVSALGPGPFAGVVVTATPKVCTVRVMSGEHTLMYVHRYHSQLEERVSES